MMRSVRGSKDPDILASEKALRRAARRAREIGRRTGTPVYVLKNGRIIDILAERTSAKRRRKQPRASRNQL